MSNAVHLSATKQNLSVPVKPSIIDPKKAKHFTLDQELKPFGKWTDAPIWVPPKDSSSEMAESMLNHSGLFTAKSIAWSRIVAEHREQFTQVREIELEKASIRLPKGKLFVTVTEQRDFEKIADEVPACVQTRLEEFLAGPGKKRGVTVRYLKPLCVEVDDKLHFTSREDVVAAIEKIQTEVFAEFRKRYLPHQAKRAMVHFVKGCLLIPNTVRQCIVNRRQRAIDTYHAKLEFQRRRTALLATETHLKCRTDGCTFNEMLALTNPLELEDVIEQFGVEQELSKAQQRRLIRMAAGSVPWFTALSMSLSYLSTVTLTIGAPVAVCDPAFVAEFPDAPGQLMNIGHFDEIAGIRHVEF